MSRPVGQRGGLPNAPGFSGAGYLRKKPPLNAAEPASAVPSAPSPTLPVLLLTAPIVAPSARALWRALSRRIDLNDPTEILAGVQHLINHIDAAPRAAAPTAAAPAPSAALEHAPGTVTNVAPPASRGKAEEELHRNLLILTAQHLDTEESFESDDLNSNLWPRREP